MPIRTTGKSNGHLRGHALVLPSKMAHPGQRSAVGNSTGTGVRGRGSAPVHNRATVRNGRLALSTSVGSGIPEGRPRRRDRRLSFKAEYIWIDGTEPTAQAPLEDQDPRGRRASCRIWGFDGSSTNQAPGHTSDCVLKPVFTCPDPIRGGDNMLVLCEVCSPTAPRTRPTPAPCSARSPRSTPTRSRGSASSRSTPSSRSGRPLGLPEPRLPRPAGRLLLRRRRRRGLRPRDRREAPGRLHRGRPDDLRHQRRGHARPVGVPDRPGRPGRGRRPPVGRPLAALPHRRGVRRRRHPGRQAGQG